MGTPFETKHWSLWVQPDGPNTDVEYLGCHDADDLSEPGKGIAEIIRCFRADGAGWDVLGATTNPPDMVTTTISGLIEKTADWLERISEQDCEFPLHINGALCPPYDVFGNTQRSFHLEHAEIGTKTLTNLAKREEPGVSGQSFEISAWPPVLRARAMTLGRQQIAEYSALNDIHFGNAPKCFDDCGAALPICSYGIVVADAPAGSPAVVGDVYYTQDGGINWNLCAGDPFVAGEDIISGVIFQIGANTYRLLVARELDAPNPMEVAYSDDWGANWTPVVVGTAALGANYEGALFVLDAYHIWLCLDTGYIYFSDDFGATWTRQAGGAGAPTANDLNEIWFADDQDGMCVGDNGTVLVTNDGGATWTLATQPNGTVDVICCTENAGGGIWWAGDIQGNLWYSNDQGTTWTQRAFPGDGAGRVPDIEFANTLIGFLLHDDAKPEGSMFRTRNGGRDWELITDLANAGLNSVHACSTNVAYAVGEVYQPGLGGTAVILKGSD